MKKLLLTLLAGLILGAGAVFGQVTNARIVGTVADKEGVGLPGVTVQATSPKLVGRAVATTDENGVFRLLNLVPGAYEIKFELNGFQTLVRKDVVLGVEQTITLDAAMELSRLSEEVVVMGQAPLIDVKSYAKDLTMSKTMFSALPKDRDFASLVTVLPGVSTESFAGGVDRAGASSKAGGISVDGATASENVFFVDGVNTTHLEDGTMTQKVNFDFLDEIQVKASGYQAESGGSLGGVVNVITRSGGNTFHGDVLG